jgi:general stress protein YciG
MPTTKTNKSDDKQSDSKKGSSGNFADDPKKASDAGKKGGKASHSSGGSK